MAIYQSCYLFAVKYLSATNKKPSRFSVRDIQADKRYERNYSYRANNPAVHAVLEAAELATSYMFTDEDVKYMGEHGEWSYYLVSV